MSSQNPEYGVYSASQVDNYLSRVAFPVDQWPKIATAAAQTDEGLRYLTKLQKCHLVMVPFENMSLHYNDFPRISLDKENLFDKIVVRRRGGYCMEQNILFATILRTLGFEVVQSGARVLSPSGEFTGWNHQINFVRIANQVYVVDVGFGGAGPTQPLPLINGHISKWGATGAEMRLLYQEPTMPFLQGLWVYEHRVSENEEWKPTYSFGMTEFFQSDFEVMNHGVSTRRTVFFTYQLVCMKMLFDEKADDISGIVSLLGKTFKRRVYADSEVLVECSSEDERVKILKDHFGIELSAKEQAGIKDTVAEIK